MHRSRQATVTALLVLTTFLTATPPEASAAPAADPFADIDNRPPAVAPLRSLAATGDVTRWNDLGTPAALFRNGDSLAADLPGGPEAVARGYLARSRALFSLSSNDVDDLETIATTPVGDGAVVLLRQRFGGLPAAYEGQVAVAVKGDEVLRVTSSLSPETAAPEPATLTSGEAVTAALTDNGLNPGELHAFRVRQVAVPMPGAAPRAAWEVVAISADPALPLGYTTYVDARDGTVLVRVNLVDAEDDNARWDVFPASGADPRQTWCSAAADGCARVVTDPATGHAWDQTATTGKPTTTTIGNSAQTVRYWEDGSGVTASPRSDREYVYPFTDQWHASGCDPASLTSPAAADSDAAMANLFAMHNRMHDWSYHLGFTEATWNLQYVNPTGAGLDGDAELGIAQSGAATIGTRNNANQATGPDGVPAWSHMYMWQPRAGSAYPACADGSLDMSVIGHEYGHAISNRMIAGPEDGLGAGQAGAMGESWSDLIAMEYLWESGYRPAGYSTSVLGGYVTGDLTTGIRNYDMAYSPLNYSDYGYDRQVQVHADGEIWSAVNYDIRRALLTRYPVGNDELCANGTTPVTSCAGNRRWIQLVLDSFLLQGTGDPTMVDMRDNMITADVLRFDGVNAALLWNAFAARGLGAGAHGDYYTADPTPSFASPYARNVTVRFKPGGDATGRPVRLYVGDYEAGATPVADTDPATDLPDTVTLAAGTYKFLAVGAGLGARRFTQTVYDGVTTAVGVAMPANLASTANGAVVDAALGDDTESTTWYSDAATGPRQATADLAGDAATLVSRVQLSAYPGGITSTGNLFATVRKFEVRTCNADAGADCTTDAGYTTAYVSADNAFDTGPFRPKVPELILKSFTLRPVLATHARLIALTNQCTANPRYAGERDNDPRTATDCAANSSFDAWTYVSEFQVFAS